MPRAINQQLETRVDLLFSLTINPQIKSGIAWVL